MAPFPCELILSYSWPFPPCARHLFPHSLEEKIQTGFATRTTTRLAGGPVWLRRTEMHHGFGRKSACALSTRPSSFQGTVAATGGRAREFLCGNPTLQRSFWDIVIAVMFGKEGGVDVTHTNTCCGQHWGSGGPDACAEKKWVV